MFSTNPKQNFCCLQMLAIWTSLKLCYIVKGQVRYTVPNIPAMQNKWGLELLIQPKERHFSTAMTNCFIYT